jgi:hypothetical protein
VRILRVNDVMKSPRSKERPAARKTGDQSEKPDKVGFLPRVLDRTVIAVPLLEKFER